VKANEWAQVVVLGVLAGYTAIIVMSSGLAFYKTHLFANEIDSLHAEVFAKGEETKYCNTIRETGP
jgi:hypothetical protein